MTSSKKVSLSEVNQSIDTPNNNRFWQNLKAFLGPGALVAVGYMDPGNWITSVVGGATYKYSLLFVILISSLIAMQLQQMAGKLGIVTQMDLAQATAYHSPKWLRYTLWVILELALMATDLAEVLGSANYGCHSGDSPRCLPTPTHHETGIQENRGYCFNLDFDHLGYLCLPGSLV